MVPREEIQALADEIAEKFPAVQRIILFGSHAYGTPHEWSDVDLVVLMEWDPAEVRDPGWEIDRAVTRRFSRDILVYPPDVFERGAAQHDPIPRMARDRGVVLYDFTFKEAERERDRAAVA